MRRAKYVDENASEQENTESVNVQEEYISVKENHGIVEDVEKDT